MHVRSGCVFSVVLDHARRRSILVFLWAFYAGESAAGRQNHGPMPACPRNVCVVGQEKECATWVWACV